MIVDVVMVTYQPNLNLLKRTIDSIIDQVRFIYVVDNTEGKCNFDVVDERIRYIALGENKGIAEAQNIGIAKSVKAGSDFLILSDQDTIYPSDFVDNMQASFDKGVAMVCPLFRDVNKKSSNDGFVISTGIGFKRIYPQAGTVEIYQAIASGSMISVSTLSDIGYMDEHLFIDWVDLEWCWRAVSKGFRLLGNADVLIEHQLGDATVSLGYRDVNLRSPIRHYYITRNAFYLSLRSKHLNSHLKILLFLKSFRYLFAFPILCKPRLTNLKMVVKGFSDGILGRLGKF